MQTLIMKTLEYIQQTKHILKNICTITNDDVVFESCQGTKQQHRIIESFELKTSC